MTTITRVKRYLRAWEARNKASEPNEAIDPKDRTKSVHFSDDSALTLQYIINTLVDSVLVVPAKTQLQNLSEDEYDSQEDDSRIPYGEEDEEHVKESSLLVEDALLQKHYYKLEESLISILLPVDGPHELDVAAPSARRSRDWVPRSLEATRSMNWRLAADEDDEA